MYEIGLTTFIQDIQSNCFEFCNIISRHFIILFHNDYLDFLPITPHLGFLESQEYTYDSSTYTFSSRYSSFFLRRLSRKTATISYKNKEKY